MTGPRGSGPDGQRAGEPDPGDPSPDTPRPDTPRHDDTGLDLARSIARSLAASRPARRGGGGRSSPRSVPRSRTDPQVSGAHPDDRDPQTLDATVARLVAEQGWSTEVRVHGVFSRWERIVGPEVAQHARPEAFRPGEPGSGGKLTVRTDSTAWATQMRLLAATVVRRLNEELGDETVAVLDVLGPAAPSWSKGRRSIRGGRGPRDTYG